MRLNGTKVSDAGLKYFSGMSSLELLSLEGTQISDEGLGKLQQALPDCGIAK